MKQKVILAVIFFCVCVIGWIMVGTVKQSVVKPDLVELNRIKHNVENTDDISFISFESKYDFTVVTLNEGLILYSTIQTDAMSFDERINQATTNYDTILDFDKNGTTGKVIVYTGKLLTKGRISQIPIMIGTFAFLLIFLGVYFYYIKYRLYGPFRRLKNFAINIATGNLEIPLPMDKNNLFGDFTESFDIMRSELQFAKQKAIDEERSKKELIASLSHDIKTPIAIVRAASELLEINETNPSKLGNIKAIQLKTYEIDSLITDLFSSVLDDLSELKITVTDIESSVIEKMVNESDPLSKVRIVSKIPECLVRADCLRLGQIFGNIIANSYKYSGTEIDVSFSLIDQYLRISFKDYGSSLTKEELPLILNKFYRGRNSVDKQGAGLGLYICAQFLERMGGSIDCDLEKDGFRVDVSLILS